MQQNADLAQDAQAKWRLGQAKECLAALRQMKGNLAGEGKAKIGLSKVEHNEALAEFVDSGAAQVQQLLKRFAEVSRCVDEEGKAAAAAASGAEAAEGKAAPQGSNSGEQQQQEDKQVDQQVQGSKDSSKGRFQPDAAFALYNQAVVHVFSHKWRSALVILEDLFRYIDALDEGLALCICFLLLDVYTLAARGAGFGDGGLLSGHIVEKAQSVVDYLEKPHAFNGQREPPGGGADASKQAGEAEAAAATAAAAKKSGDAASAQTFSKEQTDNVCMRLAGYKYKLLLIQAAVSSTKPDPKVLQSLEAAMRGVPAKDATAAGADSWQGLQLAADEHGNLNPAQARTLNPEAVLKCVKANLEFLNGSFDASHKQLRESAASGLDQGIFLNNVGCIHHALGQHNCAAIYFGRALEHYKAQGKHLLGTNCTPEVAYNLGVQLLHCGQPIKAYECLSTAARCNFHRPRLWLHVAECVVMSQAQSSKRGSVLRGITGKGVHRRLVLNATEREAELEAGLDPQIGLRASNHVLYLLRKAEHDSDVGYSRLVGKRVGKAGASDKASATDGAAVAVVLESDLDHCRQQAGAMRATAMLCRAYLALLVRDWALARSAAESAAAAAAAAEPADPNTLAIAHAYCAEAIINTSLDAAAKRQALEHLVASISADLETPADSALTKEARGALCVNTALVRMYQNDFEEAQRLLFRALEIAPEAPSVVHLFVYCCIQRGELDRARRLLKTNR